MIKRFISFLTMLSMTLILLNGGGIPISVSAAADDIAINETNFPDENFRQYVKDEIDKNKDDVLAWDEWISVGVIDCKEKSIADFTGIGYFTSLMTLDCSKNEITSLDLSKNTELIELYCCNNKLTSLDLSKNTKLKWLDCSNDIFDENLNKLTSLDLSKNMKLEYLDCENNELTSLALGQSAELNTLNCDGNKLTSLDLRGNAKLTSLYCSYNKLTALDVSQNAALKLLRCESNELTSLDISKNTVLENLMFKDNQLTYIDVSQNAALKLISCADNYLTSLDLSQNTALTTLRSDSNIYTRYTVDTCIIDPDELPGEFDLSKASEWKNAEVIEDKNGGKKILYKVNSDIKNEYDGDVTYLYDCGQGKSVTFRIKFKSHDAAFVTEKEADCTTAGSNINHYKCSVCGYNFKDESCKELIEVVETPPTGHDYGDRSIAKFPTLTETGTAKRICKNNNEHIEEKEIPVLTDTTVWTKDERSHVEPTEETEGKDVYTGEYGTVEVILPKKPHEHSMKLVPEKPATKEEYGVKEHWHCDGCGKDFLDKDGREEATPDRLKIGKLEKVVDKGEKAPATTLETPLDALKEAVGLTGEEVNAGENIKIILKVEDATDTVLKEDKTAVTVMLGKLKNYKLGQYLDVILLKKIGELEQKITETNAPVRIMFEVPEGLRGKSEYSVIRIHGGETTILKDLDSNPNTVTIETDKFSTYALAYLEKGDESGDTSGDTSDDTTGGTTGDTSDDTTGDTSDDATGGTTGDTSDDTTGDTTGDTSDDTMGDTSGDTSDGTSGDMSGNTSDGILSDNPVTGVALSFIPIAAILSGMIVVVNRKKK